MGSSNSAKRPATLVDLDQQLLSSNRSICGFDVGFFKLRIAGAVDDEFLGSSHLKSVVDNVVTSRCSSTPDAEEFNSWRNDMMSNLNNNNVSDCCIGIPLRYTCQERRSLLCNATNGGWRPCKLLHQTTAAALMYRFCSADLLQDCKVLNIAFIDMGEWHGMQMSIVEIKEDQLKILSHAHDKLLRGNAFEKIVDKHFSARNLFFSDAKSLKERLSTKSEVAHGGIVLKRVEFEDLISTLLEKVKIVLRKVLNESGITVDDIHSVQVVGKGSKIPAVIKELRDFFKKEPMETILELKSVAMGCFIQCAMLCGAHKIPEFQIVDILPYSIELDDETEKQVLFPKGHPIIPTIKSVTFHRSSTFFLHLVCNHPDNPDWSSLDLISYMIGPFDCTTEKEVEVKVQLDLHGISCIESAILQGNIIIPVVEYEREYERAGRQAEQHKLLIDSYKHRQRQEFLNTQDKIIAAERIDKEKLGKSKVTVALQLTKSNARLETTTKQHEELETTLQKAENKLVDISAQFDGSLHAKTKKRIELEELTMQLMNSLDVETNKRIEVEGNLEKEISKREKLQQELEQYEELQTALRDEVQKTKKDFVDISAQLKDSLSAETQKRAEVEKNLEDEKSERMKLQIERDNALNEVENLRQMIDWQSRVVNFKIFSLLELKVATEDFHNSLKIGEGGYGSVYKGTLQNKLVAIKILNERVQEETGEASFNQEVEILTQVRHPNIISLIGANREARALIFEFAPNGSLNTLLTSGEKSSLKFDWHDRIRIASEICSALIFLHSIPPHGIAHGDLKPDNILLDSNYISKLADFGISRKLQKIDQRTTLIHLTDNPKFTPAYCDPDFFSSGEVTSQGDIYSFGIIVLQLVTGRNPKRIKDFVEEANERDKWDGVVDISAGEWPIEEAKKLALVGLWCSDASRRKRPGLAKDVLPLIESMKNFAELTFKK